ncbi:MFS transporter [Streptomyces anulatus]|uniref:MFS transporter n=1 Tax=Streptomyces sp. SID7499 TaxID=2706086 RepID=A0A6G3WKJ0_9ACTN|nr:MFS transporter [Streptomyces anulatus]NDZ58332.1 MFS transporter [Streptomyces anulatus]NEE05972.1 MFS transporter [Streptomyces sp. SID7499]
MIMSSPSVAPSYAAVLRTRYACRTFGASLLGRLSYGMVSFSLVLAIKEATGSYAAAGTVMALFALTSVFLSPVRAGLVDRYGPRRALRPMAAAYAFFLTGLAFATAWPGTSGILLGILAVPTGACTPPLGPVMRTLWSDLVPDRRLLQRAYSLDAVAEELLFVTGPLLVGLLVQIAAPPAGLALSAALVLIGALALSSSPAVRDRTGQEKDPLGPTTPEGRAPGARTRLLRRSVLHGDPGMRQALTVSAAVGMCLGAFDLLVIAFADEHGTPSVVAWVLAALSGGSAIGGLVYGAVPWRASSRLRLALLAVAMGLTLAAMGLSHTPYLLIAWAAIGGLFVAPALTTAYLIADECADPARRTRASAWVNTSFNAGSAGATAAVGHLVGRLPLPMCFALAAVPVLLSATTALRRSRRSAPEIAAPTGLTKELTPTGEPQPPLDR